MSAVPQQQNPFEGFFSGVGNAVNGAIQGAGNLVRQVQNSTPVQQVENSPLGLAVQGKFNQVVPAVQKEFSMTPTIAGKPYSPQLMAGGEIQDVSGMGIDPMTGLPKTGMTTAQATGTSTGEYPYAKPANVSQSNAAQNQNIRQIRYKGSGTAPQKEANANATLDRLGIKGDANQQLGMFQTAKNNIYNWIKSASSMATNEVQIPINEIKTAITDQVQREFGTKLSSDELNKVVTDQMNNVYDRAQQDIKQPQAQGQPTTPYFNSTSDMNPSTAGGQSATGNYTAPPASFVPGKTIPQIKNAAINNPIDEATLNFNPPAPESAQPRFAYNDQATAPLPNQPQAAGYGDITPNTIGSRSVYNMKVAANNTPEVNNAFSKIIAGNRADLTDSEKAAIAGRTGLDNVLTKYHPDVKQATSDLSILNDKNVINSVESARFKAPGAPPTLGDKFKGFFKNPLVDIGLGAIGYPAATQIPKLASDVVGGAIAIGQNMLNPTGDKSNGNTNDNPFKNPSQTNNGGVNQDINHSQSVSQNSANVNNQDQNGHYILPTQSAPDPNYMTYTDWQKARGAVSPYDPAYNQKVNQIDSQYNASLARAKNVLSGEKTTFMNPDGAKFFLDSGNKVKDELAIAPTNFLNSLKGYSSIQAYLSANPKAPYQQELSDIDRLNTQYIAAFRMVTGERLNPGDQQLIQPGDSAKQAYIKWKNIMDFFITNYKNNLSAYNAQTSSSGNSDTQGQPVPAPTGLSTQGATQAGNGEDWSSITGK